MIREVLRRSRAILYGGMPHGDLEWEWIYTGMMVLMRGFVAKYVDNTYQNDGKLWSWHFASGSYHTNAVR